MRHTNRKFRVNVGKWNFKSIKAVIDLFGILLNQDLFLLMEDLKKKKDISVLAGVPYTTPSRVFRASRARGIPFPFPFKCLSRRLIDKVQNMGNVRR